MTTFNTDTHFTKHFAKKELWTSRDAVRLGIDNKPTIAHENNLRALCEFILEPTRTKLGHVITVTSGYRSPELNAVTPNASSTSQHAKGEAADIECFAISTLDLARTIINLGLPFDQLILEHHHEGDQNSGWVHVSHRRVGAQRGQVLSARYTGVGKGRRTEYVSGLHVWP